MRRGTCLEDFGQELRGEGLPPRLQDLKEGWNEGLGDTENPRKLLLSACLHVSSLSVHMKIILAR